MFLETWEIIRSRAVKIGVELDLNSISPVSTFEVRKVQITQVIYNILSNAIEAVKDITVPSVSVSVNEVSDNIEITVSDNGPGLSETITNKVWEPFYTSKDLSHAGMGLSTSKGIIEAHKGSIEYKRNDSSTQFVIKIPCFQSKELEKDAS